MSGYRPLRFNGLGAHVSGVSAWVLVQILERSKALDSIQKMPGPARDEVLATYDTLRAAGVYWGQHQRGAGATAETAPLEGVADDEAAEMREVTAAEAAALVGCSDRRVRQLLTEGRLTGRLKAGRWLIDATSVEDYRLAKDVA